MKRLYISVMLCVAAMCAWAQVPMPEWTKQLVNLNPEVIDSIQRFAIDPELLADYDLTPADMQTRTYIVYYHQPVKHSNPTGQQFSLRATITVFNDADVTTAVNHLYCGGYALQKDWLKMPDAMFVTGKNESDMEIAHRYHANFISLEYRYFQYSAPERCYENLDDLRSEEAAEDFHNLLTALKKVMKGKWVMSGVSKGGAAALLQHAFHPEDADIFVPYSAPFFDTNCDTVMQTYWQTHGWNKEYRDMIMDICRQFTQREATIYPLFYKMLKDDSKTDDYVYGRYLATAAHFGYQEHTYSDTAELRKNIDFNGNIMYLYDVHQYNDTVYAIMAINGQFKLNGFGNWIEWLRSNPGAGSPSRPVRSAHSVGQLPFGVTEAEWWGNETIGKAEQAYEYQSKTELGYYDLRFDLIVGAESALAWNAAYKKYVGTLRDFDNPYYASCTFNRSLYDLATSTTKNATKPIIFLYGEDDSWTGAAMKDRFVNGTNVQKFILPAQNHGVHFTSNTDPAKCKQITDILDGVLGAPQTALTTITQPDVRVRKVLRDGMLLIERDGQLYTMEGRKAE